MSKVTSDMPLIDFFENEYRQAKLPRAAAGTIICYVKTISQFSKHLGRTALIANLSDSEVAAFAESIRERVAKNTLDYYLSRLLGLAWFAYHTGKLPSRPNLARNHSEWRKESARMRNAIAVQPIENVAAIESVSDYFEAVFLERCICNVAPGTVRKYRCSINRASDFLQREAQLKDLSDEFFGALSKWMSGIGYREKRVQVYRQSLRAVAAQAKAHGYAIGKVSRIDPLAKRAQGNRRHWRKLKGPNKKTQMKISKAASMFANGSTLQQIGDKLGVTAHAVHNWRGRYHKLWQAAYQAAVTRSADKLALESAENSKLLEASDFAKRAIAAERGLQEQGKSLVKRTSGKPKDCPTLSELVADMAAERALRPNTLGNYHHAIRTLERYMGKVLYADCFNRIWANRWLAELDNSTLAKATVAGYRRHLLAMWRVAVESEWCEEVPRRIRQIRFVKPMVDAWSLEEVNLLIAAAAIAPGVQTFKDDTTGESIEVPNSLLWRLMIRVMWDTGLRPGDACKLRCPQINDEGVIVLRQGKTQTAHVCKLHDSTLRLIEEICRPKNGKLIPWDKSSNARATNFRKLCMGPAGLSGELYKLRKSSASDVESNHPGMGAVHLGHSLGADIARTFYLKPELIAKNRPMPTELTGDLKKPRNVKSTQKLLTAS